MPDINVEMELSLKEKIDAALGGAKKKIKASIAEMQKNMDGLSIKKIEVATTPTITTPTASTPTASTPAATAGKTIKDMLNNGISQHMPTSVKDVLPSSITNLLPGSDAAGTLEGAATKAKILELGLMGVGAAAAFVVSKVVDFTVQWNAAMDDVNLKLNMTQPELASLGQQIETIGLKGSSDLLLVPKALMAIKDEGLSLQQSLKSLPDVLNAAKYLRIDTSAVGSSVGSYMHVTGLETKQAIDAITTGMRESQTDLKTWTDTMASILPDAKNVDQGTKIIAAAFANLNKTGHTTQESSDILQNITKLLADPKLVKGFQDAGIHMKDLHGNILPLNVILGELETKTANMSTNKKAGFFTRIGLGPDNAVMIDDMVKGLKGFNAELDAANKPGGALPQTLTEMQKMTDTMTEWKNSLLVGLRGVGETLARGWNKGIFFDTSGNSDTDKIALAAKDQQQHWQDLPAWYQKQQDAKNQMAYVAPEVLNAVGLGIGGLNFGNGTGKPLPGMQGYVAPISTERDLYGKMKDKQDAAVLKKEADKENRITGRGQQIRNITMHIDTWFKGDFISQHQDFKNMSKKDIEDFFMDQYRRFIESLEKSYN